MDLFKKVFDFGHRLLDDINSNDEIEKLHEFQENNELALYLRFIDSQSFDKKLKGINGIREYILRSDPSSADENNKYFKPLAYFNKDKLSAWILDNKVIERIYLRHQNIELIKRSIDILKFLGDNLPEFPTHLLDIIWNSQKDKHEEMVLQVYNVIAEIGFYLGLDRAEYMYRKFLEVKVEDYDEDFINLIGKYTESCLRLVAFKNEGTKLSIK